VIFKDYSIKEAILETMPNTDWPIPDKWIDWEYDPNDPTPMLAVDRDLIPIVLWLPKFLADAGHVSRQLKLSIIFSHHLQDVVQIALSHRVW